MLIYESWPIPRNDESWTELISLYFESWPIPRNDASLTELISLYLKMNDDVIGANDLNYGRYEMQLNGVMSVQPTLTIQNQNVVIHLHLEEIPIVLEMKELSV